MKTWWWGRYIEEGQTVDGERIYRNNPDFIPYTEEIDGLEAGKLHMSPCEQRKFLNTEPVDCRECGYPMKDLTKGCGNGRNFYCDICGAHYYSPVLAYWSDLFAKAVWYTKQEWAQTFEGCLDE